MAELITNDFTDQFWQLIEKDMGCIVPTYLKYILRVRGYDNGASVGTLTTNDIHQIQGYFKDKLQKDFDQEASRKKYCHIFYSDSDVFEILPGHVKLLEKIVSHINSVTTVHGPGYFDPRFEKNFRKTDSKVCKSAVQGRV